METKSHPLHNPLIEEEIQSEIRKYFDLRENKNTMYQNVNKMSMLKNTKKSQSNDLNFHLKKLEQKSKLNTKKQNIRNKGQSGNQ